MSRRDATFTLILVSVLVFSAFAQEDEPADEASTAGAQKRALLIGVNDYSFIEDLRYCSRDIESLRQRLVAAGFPPKQVTLLRDGADQSKYQPIKTNIDRELTAMLAAAKPGDLIVVAFSGHGVELDGISYLCPVGARLDDAEGSLISLEDIYRRVDACEAGQKLLLVDACRDDPRQGGLKGIKKPPKILDGFSRSLETPPDGILVFTSCKPGEVSFEDDECRHGVFMNFVLKGLEGEADRAQEGNTDDQISLFELYGYASQNTKTHVARTRNRVQTPMLRGQVAGGDYRIAAALPARPEELPSRFYRLGGRTIDNMLFMDPGVITAADPQALLTLRQAHDLLVTGMSYGSDEGIPLVDCEQALALANEAIRLEPTNAFGFLLRGIAYRKRGDYVEAMADFQRLGLSFQVTVGMHVLTDIELHVGDEVTGKLDYMDRLTVTKVDGGMLWVESIAKTGSRPKPDDERKGWLDQRFVNPEILEKAAETDWYTSRSLAERTSPRSIGRERIEPIQADDPTALDSLERARDLLGEASASGNFYVKSRPAERACDDAIAACDEALEAEPKNASAYLLRGLAHRQKGNFEKALADSEKGEKPLVMLLRRRSLDLKAGNEVTATARLGNKLTITKANGDWLWINAVEGDITKNGWASKSLLLKEESYTARAFTRSDGGLGGFINSDTIRRAAYGRLRGLIPYSGFLPF